jgi:antitoxin component YwqK of YwqJK toxin-antitoxin module
MFVAVGGTLLFAGLVAAQATSAKSGATQSAPTASASDSGTIRKAEERIRIEPYTGPPIFLEEKKMVVPPSIVTREVVPDKFPDGKLRIERQIAKYSDDHYESDGFYREYYPNGQKFLDGQYRQGRREGDWTYWFDNGQVNRMVTFQNGQLNGEWEVYRADGTLSAKQAFDSGLRNGDWTTYDATGKQPLAEQHYAKGKTDGIWKTWFPNGKLQLQVSIKMGLRHGPSMQWSEDGSPLSESNWVEGKQDGTTTRWTDKGKIVQQYKLGLLVSEKKE